MTRWKPDIEAADGRPLYQALFDAIARDRASGRLPAGSRLPPHRDLAADLGIGVGTVTKAYAEAERRGLIHARVGAGSFVTGNDQGASPPPRAPGPIDLSRNLAPSGHAEPYLAAAMARLAAEDPAALTAYAPVAGAAAVRAAAAAWSVRTGTMALDPERLIICNGAQQGLALALAVTMKPGATLLCEAATYAGTKQIATVAGYRLRGVALDGEGVDPDALDRAAAETGAAVVYLVPTLQNPTGRRMSAARREAIAAVVRRRGLILIEDDVYALYGRDLPGVPALAELLPDRAFHIGGAAKSLAPGLRAGWLLPPEGGQWREAVLRHVRAAYYAPAAIGHHIFRIWVEEGVADRIAGAILNDAAGRLERALAIVGDAAERPASRHAMHLWLPMSAMEAERVSLRALRAGVELTPPESTAVDPALLSGLRLCLDAVDAVEMEGALRIVMAALSADMEASERAIV
ncbi:GntR family transcriptional regulator [Sphingomonas oleivorans]|uniref:GntR family transcriptional regulator n=1 Tax=Sphingomonas oleivorans TaxID=1735121 RepID=A0A2T5G1G9_9SPHN|nr:PLP-dependent aminotransferase family protein [Sphingomonas oleivorans]PTQ12996.1 GntR family transcriptional regulator [Sphingomonas oleivorans]